MFLPIDSSFSSNFLLFKDDNPKKDFKKKNKNNGEYMIKDILPKMPDTITYIHFRYDVLLVLCSSCKTFISI